MRLSDQYNWIKFVFHLFVLTFFAFVSPAFANQERFDEAVELWLGGDDAMSLPMMSELANEGFEPAMLFLGRIQNWPAHWSPWLTSLSDEDRVELLTADGKNWLTKVVDDAEFALGLLSIFNGAEIPGMSQNETLEQFIPMALGFIERGEYANAYMPFAWGQIYWEPTPEELQKALAQQLPDYLLPLQWSLMDEFPTSALHRSRTTRTIRNALLNNNLSALSYYGPPNGSPERRAEFNNIATEAQKAFSKFTWDGIDFTHDTPEPTLQYLGRFSEILQRDKQTAQLVNYCERKCPTEVTLCTGLLFMTTGAHLSSVMSHSPLQSIIPDTEYFISPRFEMDMFARSSQREIDFAANDFELGVCTSAILDEMRLYNPE